MIPAWLTQGWILRGGHGNVMLLAAGLCPGQLALQGLHLPLQAVHLLGAWPQVQLQRQVGVLLRRGLRSPLRLCQLPDHAPEVPPCQFSGNSSIGMHIKPLNTARHWRRPVGVFWLHLDDILESEEREYLVTSAASCLESVSCSCASAAFLLSAAICAALGASLLTIPC